MKKYIPDILILLGVWLFTFASYTPLFPLNTRDKILFERADYTHLFKFIAVIIVSLGIYILIKRYFNKKK